MILAFIKKTSFVLSCTLESIIGSVSCSSKLRYFYQELKLVVC